TLTISGRRVDCPPEKNLVMKAYRALAETVELPPVDIFLRKIIPDGAGLGGGSADAAFTLRGLNELFALGLSDSRLAEIAAGLGADCPFFIYNSQPKRPHHSHCQTSDKCADSRSLPPHHSVHTTDTHSRDHLPPHKRMARTA
ncbi:4-(cytidine 5'-diphospho)-2-C-methyl-D-erythritol kinase, partial [Duncaniella muris]|uniref:4-(cytidine 5'-diphospho)-2-C-methyl-D-erythritol kinase n=1 Tax=Duncaniella muris TaxID=2094150 RepID=UPI0034E42F58